MMRNSLKWRVTASMLIVLLAGFSWLVDLARGSVEQSMEIVLKQDLTGRLYGLLANAEFDETKHRLDMKGRVGDPAFSRPGSGYSAFLLDEHGVTTWISASSISLEFDDTQPTTLGHVEWIETSSHYYATLSFEWSLGDSVSGPWKLVVRGDKALMLAPIEAFLHQLYMGLMYIGIAIIAVLAVLMFWQWHPVTRLEKELIALEAGEQNSIDASYPRELDRLVKRLNAYIAHSHHQTEATRHYLENLAHNLKTPLAVLHSCSQSRQLDYGTIDEQTNRMEAAINVAVQKAQVANRPLVVKSLAVASIVDRMSIVMRRVHLGSNVSIKNSVDRDLKWLIEEGDAFELLGNLLDNAIKYGATRMNIHSAKGGGVVYIDDNGPGICPSKRTKVLERGARLDQRVEGEGIGLAIVKVMLNAYHGDVSLDESPLGGLRVVISLPSEVRM